jgi:hypothetical protein
MSHLEQEQVIHRRPDPEIRTSNSQVVVKYNNRVGACQQKCIALTGLAAFILNIVNQTSSNTLVEQDQDKQK